MDIEAAKKWAMFLDQHETELKDHAIVSLYKEILKLQKKLENIEKNLTFLDKKNCDYYK